MFCSVPEQTVTMYAPYLSRDNADPSVPEEKYGETLKQVCEFFALATSLEYEPALYRWKMRLLVSEHPKYIAVECEVP